MKTIFNHIEHAKGKPHHVRKQIAFGAAAGTTALIALVWFGHALSTNVFAIKGTSFAESTGRETVVTVSEVDSNPNLAGAAAAARNASLPARIEIVDTASSTRKTKQVEQTIIPF